ncbi:hypothetical protein BLNAU_4920 [Blattamonas nauphoetae]|uniref:Uncharacterized protein n=1 Tax=Blattamonas nauphoetae TaxID=2049346 RepID=A0ABQ9Y8H6_9EUKA|nr:hypothetical protein BLNAU_4920 [Blattamonas nauphoetae]
MTRRIHLTRMTPPRFCGLSSDVGNALIAGADEQILGWPPIVQKWIALLVDYALTHFSRSGNRFPNSRPKSKTLNILGESVEMEQIVLHQVTAVPQRAHIRKRKRRSTEPANPDLVIITIRLPHPTLHSSPRVSLSLERLHDSRKHHALHDAKLDTLVTGMEPLLPIDCERQKERMEQAQRPLLFHSEDISPFWLGAEYIAKLVTDLVPSSDGSPSGFVESIVTLLSSPHSAVVAAALSFLYITLFYSSLSVRCRLMESDLVSKVFAILQPHTVQISGNETIIYTLIQTFYSCIKLAFPSSLVDIGLTTAVDKHNHREMIFQKVVIPSSGFLTILISNRHVISEDFFDSFMSLLDTLLQIGPFHRPTVEFVLASPIVMAFSSCLSPVENRGHIRNTLINIEQSLQKWKDEGQEVVQCGKRMIQALFSEGFEDTLEQKMMNDTDEYDGRSVVDDCLQLSQLLGSNAKRPR